MDRRTFLKNAAMFAVLALEARLAAKTGIGGGSREVRSLPPVSCNFGPLAAEQLPAAMENLAGAGARRLMLTARQLTQCADDAVYRGSLLDATRKNGLRIFDVHAPHSMTNSFGFPAEEADSLFFASARKAMTTAAELGARTVTFHLARTRCVRQYAEKYGTFAKAETEKAKTRVLRQLEKVMPEAEKLGLMIALENLFLPTSTAAFLVSVMREYPHPNLGLTYDSGHALVVEKQPGKRPEEIAEWIRIGWDDDTVIFQDDQLDPMLEYVITGHFHDNNGKNDEHKLPGEGIADWKRITDRLRRAPRLISVQSEVNTRNYGDDPGIQLKSFRRCGFDG